MYILKENINTKIEGQESRLFIHSISFINIRYIAEIQHHWNMHASIGWKC